MCVTDEGIIRLFQGIGSPLLDKAFISISFMGDIMFYLFLISLIYWCFNKKTGIKLFCLVLFLGYLGVFLKNVFKTPRPDPSLWKTNANGYGFPSGHVTVTTGFWSYVMMIMRRKWLTAIGFITIFFVAFSRVYLGVHFLLDVIGGFLIGAAATLLFYYLETKVRITLKFYQKILVCIFVPLVMLAVLMNDSTIQLCSMLFGLAIGYFLENRTVNIQTSIKNKTKISRALTGLILVSAVFLGLSILPSYLEFIRFILVGLTITFFAPVVFSKTDKIFT
jgi:membrane-associated phospholipid phosphatase